MSKQDDDHLAYGDYHDSPGKSSPRRNFFEDVAHRIRGGAPPVAGESPSDSKPQASSTPKQSSGMAGFLGKIQNIGSGIKAKISSWEERHSHTHTSGECAEDLHTSHHANRFTSFAPVREGNDVKWYVDGCGYFWAVSLALEQAKETIWILDCMKASPNIEKCLTSSRVAFSRIVSSTTTSEK
jgi:phospholipase D1/2